MNKIKLSSVRAAQIARIIAVKRPVGCYIRLQRGVCQLKRK